jgi:hypothetical protein
LAGEEAYAINSCAGRECRIDQADLSIAEIRPIALAFEAENKLAGLPTVTELPADDASGPITASARDNCSSHRNETPTSAGRCYALRWGNACSNNRKNRVLRVPATTFIITHSCSAGPWIGGTLARF